ncbi:MAG: bifunctional adenosylcobinamide kinase/adenosylcobinamide-phosphate guanylyltransferase [Rhodospirillaceae bacterium]|nr:bifunctional adenosylcobinamide kinase/adenosylcobinamide-phosphate guanylyltransferase [Rhodospirillaceae bacterium]MDE0616217.1 bifunctional adenosylcobinamide kinase/adenosylcobinamide-phosphate guanylyltransferase [Rhodospirillaceae bacterium]
MTLDNLTLVLGGARSGKSRHGEALVEAAPPPWYYIATAEALDDEMRRRIDKHRKRRGADWRTVEAPLDLAAALDAAPDGAPVLVDCLTLWLSNLMLEDRPVGPAADGLIEALERRNGRTVLVSNEVGLGIVPENRLARDFRDAAGNLHRRVAAIAQHVHFMVAGIPMIVKGPQ